MSAIVSQALAHVAEDGRLHLLQGHLYGTAERAAEYAAGFGCGEWGFLAALWHDLGKFGDDFQDRLQELSERGHEGTKERVGVDHSTAGALWAVKRLGPLGRLLAYVIAGHHAGLPDWQSEAAGNSALSQRLSNPGRLEKALPAIPPAILEHSLPQQKPRSGADPALWVRMLFSCVVDADFLDTENFFEAGRADLREGFPALEEFPAAFDTYMEEKGKTAADTPINRLRGEILRQCRAKAEQEPGIFTLTVPTGGGKTLSSMAFSLRHAVVHGKSRIIYVIPYTSIIEQTADQFRKIFGEAVVEHHSNVVAENQEENGRVRLAAENWDAPFVVTTAVQFFESLFSSRTSRCRKLHNIVNSVVVLDEAQLLPPDFLNPVLHVIRELRKNYGVTFLLSTATQPALAPHSSMDFEFPGLPDTVELMDDPPALHRAFKRVEVRVPHDLASPCTWDGLAEELRQHPTVLCIVNRRDDCRVLHQLMPEGTIHLSALMCGAHRSEVIGEIKRRLSAGIPTRVVSTQLVEAGVDVDFPVVYRALAGLDSIAQAAGRCNREGRLSCGEVFVFVPPSKAPKGHLRQAAEIARRQLGQGESDPIAPERFEPYFRELFWLKGPDLDKHGVLEELTPKQGFAINFRSAAVRFRIIDETQQAPVLVRYGKGAALIVKLESHGPDRRLLRSAQRYIVNLPRPLHQRLVAAGAVREIWPGIFVQSHEALYHPELGFCPDKSISYEPDELIC